MSSVEVQSFGCRASQADGAALAAALRGREFGPAPLVVLNTCTVTATADADLRQTVRRLHAQDPATRIVITGCYAQRAPAELAALPGVALVVGNDQKADLPALIEELRHTPFHGEIRVGDIFAQHAFLSPPVIDAGADRARPNLKIQDGCNNRCSFCIIPSVRGRSRSMSLAEVIGQIQHLSRTYPEVVLTGINLGRWGREAGMQMRLADLIRIVLEETGVARLRLSSVEPMDYSDDLLDLLATEPRLAQHVHAPLQSGSDRVLRRMHRRYRPRHYADRVERARRLLPDAAIGADVMVGFPGETAEEFEESRQFIEALPFTYLHVFTYSERPGTPAAARTDLVPMALRKERNRILQEIGSRKNREFRQRFTGRTLSAVTLLEPRSAMTSNFVKVSLAEDCPPHRMRDVVIAHLTPHGLREAGAALPLPPVL